MTELDSSALKVEEGRLLAPLTSMGVGGRAQYYAVIETTEGLGQAMKWSSARALPMWVLSGGSNLVVADEGLLGLVVDLRLRGIDYDVRENAVQITAAAGEDWDSLVSETVARGYSGLECLSGIPGRVGATPIQNVGAYGQDVSQTISHVGVFDRDTGAIVRVEAADCDFGYRNSRFKGPEAGRYVIVSVCFRLRLSPPNIPGHSELKQQLAKQAPSAPTVSDIRQVVLRLRRSKSMVLDPSDPCSRGCGSFFVNPVVSSEVAASIRERFASESVPLYPQSLGRSKFAAAWLIEKAGYHRGYRDGNVGLSERHSLAIVAYPEATACDVVLFARRIQETVEHEFGVSLVPEPVFWGFDQIQRGLPLIDPSR
jgi:UDP-N-acetylmuramate dehydrogenase